MARATLAPVGPVLAIGQRGGTRVERLGRVSVSMLYAALASLLALALLLETTSGHRKHAH